MKRLFALLFTLVFLTPVLAQQEGTAEVNLYDHLNRHINPNAAITSENISQLQQAWMVETEEEVSHAPLVQDGRVYFADWGGKAYAADAATGEVIWEQQVQETVMEKWPWYGFAGTGALGEGMLFEASVEGMAYGINQETGEVAWRTRVTDDKQAGSISKLLYYDGLVYIGLQSVEEPLTRMMKDFKPNFQGKVLALDAATGEVVWERQLVTKPHNGVPMWSSFALDPEMNALFFTTGNNYTGEATEFSDAIIAVDAKTGEMLWATQVTEHDVWTGAVQPGPDWDFGAGAQLFEAEVDGKMRPLVGAGQKSGIYWAFDRETGEIVWQAFVGYGAVGGGIHAEASVAEDRIYVWSNNAYMYGKPPKEFPLTVKALDAASGKTLWFKNKAQPAAIPAAGMLANDVYFVGSLDGTINAYRASDGKQLWSTRYGGAIATPLNVVGNTLFFGTGVPKMFGGQPGGNGMVAYSVGGQANFEQGEASTDQ